MYTFELDHPLFVYVSQRNVVILSIYFHMPYIKNGNNQEERSSCSVIIDCLFNNRLQI